MVCLITIDGKTLLNKFNINIQSVLSQLLKPSYHGDIATDNVSISDFVANKDLVCPTTKWSDVK